MRIDLNGRIPEAEANRNLENASKAPAGAKGFASEEARLSLDHARVQSMAAQVAAAPEIRREKVAALQGALRNVSYQIGPGQIAEAMLNQ